MTQGNLANVRLLSSHRNWDVGTLTFPFQRDLSLGSSGRCSWVAKPARGWEKIYISKGQRKYLQFQELQSKWAKKREVRGLELGKRLSKVQSTWMDHEHITYTKCDKSVRESQVLYDITYYVGSKKDPKHRVKRSLSGDGVER